MSAPKTKDEFINKAHEARKARELARRQDKAATIIQAHVKTFHLRRRLKDEAQRKLARVIEIGPLPESSELLLLLRELLFVCHPVKDRHTLDSLISFIISGPNHHNKPQSTKHITTDLAQSSSRSPCDPIASNASPSPTLAPLESPPDNVSEKEVELSRLEEAPSNLSSPARECSQLHVQKSFIASIFDSVSSEKNLFDTWLDVLHRLLVICLGYLSDNSTITATATKKESTDKSVDYPLTSQQSYDSYLNLVNMFTSSDSLIAAAAPTTNDVDALQPAIAKISSELSARTRATRRNVFRGISTFVCKLVHRARIDQKSCILSRYVQFAVRLLHESPSTLYPSSVARYHQHSSSLGNPAAKGDPTKSSTLDLSQDSAEILIGLFSVPALLRDLEQFAPKSLDELNKISIFEWCLKSLSANEQSLQNLSSTPSLCIVANLIHIAALNEQALRCELMPFVVLVTKLLESCQKNMTQFTNLKTCPSAAATPSVARGSKKKTNDTTDKSFNHILGWLAREKAATIDSDSSAFIKGQLSHLWSVKVLKILFENLTKANERNSSSKQTAAFKASSPPAPSPALSSSSANVDSSSISPKHRSNISGGGGVFTSSRQRLSDQVHQINNNCDNNNSGQTPTGNPINLLRRAVERAASSMTKTISSSYVKSSGTSSNTGSSKLMTEEASRISQVCLMLHSAHKTLHTIKQDILSGLCLHDYILKELWQYISSLSPHNGLKAFLDHLTIHTKTNAPEFYILILFCECASHLISVLDDSELYEQQKPFSLEDLVAISGFMNMFVYRIISNQLVAYNGGAGSGSGNGPITHSPEALDRVVVDPIFTTHKLLTDLYKRDCRRKFAPQDHWLIKDIKMSLFLKDLEANKPIARMILTLLPHAIPHKERVIIFRKLVAKDRAQFCAGFSTFITIHRSRIVEDGYQQLALLPPKALKGLIRVKFINDHGLDEAGIDQDGVFKEFLEDTIKSVFDPALNLFCSTSEQRLYPSPTSRLHEDYLSLFKFVGKMVGKAVYEGIVVDVPFASFFLSRVLGQPQSPLYSPIDELPSLDPELHKSLTYIKHYEGDVADLDLTFSIDQDFMGKLETHELEPGGKYVPVTRESRVRYIHSVANFRMKTQIKDQTEAFVQGFKSIVNIEWLAMFSASEFQRLISGDTSPIDLLDLRRHTKYFGGFHNNHRVVCWLWDILEKDFTAEELRLFLKFVTSCSKPPLLGFAHLEPPFSIRCVEVSDDQDVGDTYGSVLRGFFAIRRSDPVDRLPTSSTCFNLLKLPNYQRRSTLREKLRYAIRSSTGFELS